MARGPAGKPAHKLYRARKRLRRHLEGGWQRVVFSAPQRADSDTDSNTDSDTSAAPRQRVLDEPRAGPISDEDFEALMAAAQTAANEGLVKQCFVLDATRRVLVDARHGLPKLHTRDATSLLKTMGGKDRPLRPDRSAPLLRVIGIMNADGSISAKNAKKYKQVNHLVALCRPSWEVASRAARGKRALRVLDLGCGNSVLGFVLGEMLQIEGVDYRLHGIDLRRELVERSQSRAHTLGMDAMSFSLARIRDGQAAATEHLGGRPDLVLALHACDTATDEALALAIKARVPAIFCVPCCQAELARQLEPHAGQDHDGPSPALVGHGLLRRAYADLLTDAIRVEILEACGYAVQVVEFVSSEHTAKNLLLRARFRDRGPEDPASMAAALAQISARTHAQGLDPALLRALICGPSLE